jgi:hypothetical protein
MDKNHLNGYERRGDWGTGGLGDFRVAQRGKLYLESATPVLVLTAV